MNSLLLCTDVVLQDFCDIVGTDLTGIHVRVWFRNVFTENIETMNSCKDVEAPLTTQATECLAPTLAPTLASKTSAASRVPLFVATLFAIFAMVVG